MKTFLCFSSSSRNDIVEPLYNILVNVGLDIWYDYRCMLFGDNMYEKNFIEGIERSRYAIIIITQDIFGKECAIKELDYIKKLNQKGEIKIFPIFYNTTIDLIPANYKGWIKQYIFNTYTNTTVHNIKLTALQIAAKLYEEITNEKCVPALKELIFRHNDDYEMKIIEFCNSIESGNHLIQGTSLYLLYEYHTHNKKNKMMCEKNIQYLLRQLIDCHSILISSILFNIEALIRLNY